MPFRSIAQRKWMYSNHPEMAKEWESKTPSTANLPYHVKKKSKESKTGMQLLKEAVIPKEYKGYKVKVDNKMQSFGETDDEKKLVKINKKKSLKAGGKRELADTIVHEKYHVSHPKATEKVTYKKTKKIIKQKYGRK